MAYVTGEVLEIAEICEYLAADSESTSMIFRGKYERPGLSRLIYIVRNGIQWLYDYNPSDSTLLGKANFLFSLCPPFVGQALEILGSGGSGTIVNPATGVVSTIISKTVEFRVGDVDALMNAGDTSLILNYSDILNGSVSVVVDGVPIPISQSDRLSFVPVYTAPSVTINFNAPCVNGQVYVMMFLQYITI